MWTYGFFNSVNGDRTYNAEQMSHIFEGLITDGVYEGVGNKLAVQPNSGMVIQIATGRGWFDKRWVNNDAPYTMTLEASDVTLNRYVAVCIRVDSTNAVRTAVPYLKYSDFATTPTKPTMTRTATIKEYCLAYVYIPAKATAISAGNIEDTRFNTSLCGWVTGLIDQITPDTLYSQFTALFNEWFQGLVDIIDSDVETTLVNAMAKNTTVTLTAGGWSNKSQTVTVTGMTATKGVVVEATDNSYGIKCTAQGTNSLTFTCETVPSEAIQVKVLHMGV